MKGICGRLCIVFLLFAFVAGCAAPGSVSRPESSAPPPAPDYWPTQGWRATAPEEQGMDSEKLAQMVEYIQESKLPLHSLLIVRGGYLVAEIYAHPYSAGQPHHVQSVTKSVISALTGIAIQRGFIKDVDQTLLSLVSAENVKNLDEAKKSITLENLLTLTTGLDCADNAAPDKPVMQASEDWTQFVLDLPMTEAPGAKFVYCTSAVHLLSAILQNVTGMTAREFANQELFAPLGIPAVSEESWPSDPQGVTLGGYGLALAPRDMAKLGYLYLNQGMWDGKQVIPADWVAASVTKHVEKDDGKGYGYLWTVDPQGRYYAALGRAGQHIFVLPGMDMVLVFNAELPYTNNADLTPLLALMDEYILPAVKSGEPLRANRGSVARLEVAAKKLAEPEQPVPPLPPIATQVSGQTYTLAENPLGWRTLAFEFYDRVAAAQVTIDGTEKLKVGLDNLYRTNPSGSDAYPQGLRGRWESPDTFVVDAVLIGQMMHLQATVRFTGDTLLLTQRDMFSGMEVEVQGTKE